MANAILGRLDLHTHSSHSDGVLAPGELVARAAARGVSLLALTDHDTQAGCAEAAQACARLGLRFVPGIELSASWRGQAVHVIGLAGSARDTGVASHAAAIVASRRSRIEEIGARLERRGRIPGVAIARQVVESAPVPTRQHVARALVLGGFATSIQGAFDRFLGRGCEGHVPVEWPSLEQTLRVLVAGARQVVLAHPHRYKLSAGALRRLVGEFAEQGGAALEVSLAGMSPNDADRIARITRAAGLAGSAGSDFHDPAVPWNPLGRSFKLPDHVEPLAERLLTMPEA